MADPSKMGSTTFRQWRALRGMVWASYRRGAFSDGRDFRMVSLLLFAWLRLAFAWHRRQCEWFVGGRRLTAALVVGLPLERPNVWRRQVPGGWWYRAGLLCFAVSLTTRWEVGHG